MRLIVVRVLRGCSILGEGLFTQLLGRARIEQTLDGGLLAEPEAPRIAARIAVSFRSAVGDVVPTAAAGLAARGGRC